MPEPQPPTALSDHFPLVQAYGPHDDHDAENVMALVENLAACMNTNSAILGTDVVDMEMCIDGWLEEVGLDGMLYEHTEYWPTFDLVKEEVERSQDVILLLGLWQWQEVEPGVWGWVWVGAHYVTVAGVDSEYGHIAFSDPWMDNAEWLWGGRINETVGFFIPHEPIGEHAPSVHNDAANFSHHIYQVYIVEEIYWLVLDYPFPDQNSPQFQEFLDNFAGLNMPWVLGVQAERPRFDLPARLGNGYQEGMAIAEPVAAVIVSPQPYYLYLPLILKNY